MTTPDVPHRFELTVEVPGTPEQVWDAIATANGISSWMLPTDLEEREGGAVVFHMGRTSLDGHGHRLGPAPPRRLRGARLGGARRQGGADVTPLVTEFLVEAHVRRLVRRARRQQRFGTGADWEREFFAEMDEGVARRCSSTCACTSPTSRAGGRRRSTWRCR